MRGRARVEGRSRADLFFADLVGAPAPRRRRRREADLFFADLVGMPVETAAEDEEPSHGGPRFLRWSPGWRGDNLFPPRTAGSPDGATFMKSIDDKKSPAGTAGWRKRENAILAQLAAGNMPDALLRWVEIPVENTAKDGTVLKGAVKVLPDYLCVGDDGNYRHVPLDPVSAQWAADEFGALLPTAKICHAVYMKAAPANRIGAIPRDYWRKSSDPARKTPRDWDQDSTSAYNEHSEAIRSAMKSIRSGELIAGHKKDVVLSRRLTPDVDRIAFHGFYDNDGWPREPCYEPDNVLHKTTPRDMPALAHHRLFSDYSQGVRLVHPRMTIEGQGEKGVADVLAHPTLSYLISAEGPITPARIPKLGKS
jgi:hypothetical protein